MTNRGRPNRLTAEHRPCAAEHGPPDHEPTNRHRYDGWKTLVPVIPGRWG